MSVNERDYTPPIDPPFIQDTRDNIDPISNTVLSNGHQVTSNAKENSTMSRIKSTAQKIFNNLPFILKLAVGLTLIGTAIAVFVALSPKLLAVAVVVGVIGLIVLGLAIANKLIKPAKDEPVLLVEEFLLRPLENLLDKLVANHSTLEIEKIRAIIEKIKFITPVLYSAPPEAITGTINDFKKEVVYALMYDFNDLDGVSNYYKLAVNEDENTKTTVESIFFSLDKKPSEIITSAKNNPDLIKTLFNSLTSPYPSP